MKPFNFEDFACNDSGLTKMTFRCLEQLSHCEGVYGCDLHNALFNDGESYIHWVEAEKALDEIGTWDVIKLVIAYENFNFGEFNLKRIDPCVFANMMIYIIGESLLRNSTHLNENCMDRELDDKDIEIIRNEIQAYLETLNSDLTEIAFKEWGNI